MSLSPKSKEAFKALGLLVVLMLALFVLIHSRMEYEVYCFQRRDSKKMHIMYYDKIMAVQSSQVSPPDIENPNNYALTDENTGITVVQAATCKTYLNLK